MKSFFNVLGVVAIVAVGLSLFINFLLFTTKDKNEFIWNNIRNRRVAKEILADSICNVDTASSNSEKYIKEYIWDYCSHLDIKEINNFYKFETSNYQVVVIHQNFKKFSHDELTMLFVKDSEGKLIIRDNRVGDDVKNKILLKAYKEYKKTENPTPTNPTPTNIKMK